MRTPTIPNIIKALTLCVSEDSTRPTLTGLHFEVGRDIGFFTAVATNGQILLSVKRPHSEWHLWKAAILALGSLLPDAPTICTVAITKKTQAIIGHDSPEGFFGSYPMWRNVIPTHLSGRGSWDERPYFSFELLGKVEKILKFLGDPRVAWLPDEWEVHTQATLTHIGRDVGEEITLLVMPMRRPV